MLFTQLVSSARGGVRCSAVRTVPRYTRILESADMRISEIERRPESGGMKDDVLSTGDRTAAEARSVCEQGDDLGGEEMICRSKN